MEPLAKSIRPLVRPETSEVYGEMFETAGTVCKGGQLSNCDSLLVHWCGGLVGPGGGRCSDECKRRINAHEVVDGTIR